MIRLTGYCLIFLSLVGLVACDNAKDSAPPASNQQQSWKQNFNPYSLLDGRLTFSLPAVMRDESKTLTPPSNTKFIYSDSTGTESLIVLIDPPVNVSPQEQAQGLVQFYQKRVPDMKVLKDQPITIGTETLHRLDLLDDNPARKNKALSVFVIGNLYNQVITLQISLPANNIKNAQEQAEDIIKTIKLR